MEEIYWALLFSLVGGIISLLKDWKKRGEDGHLTKNLLGLFGFALIIFGGAKSCSFSRSALAEKKKSDTLANSRQDTIIRQGRDIVQLNQQLSSKLNLQLDTSITILNYSKKLIEAQNQLTELQDKNNRLQSQLYATVVGVSTVDKSFEIPIVVDKKDYLPVAIIYGNDHWKTQQLSRFSFLARPATAIDGSHHMPIGKQLLDSSESLVSLEQSLQYKIVSDLADVQNIKWILTSDKSSSDLIAHSNFSINRSFKLSDPSKINGRRILSLFSSRLFSKDFSERSRWIYDVGLPVPKGTELLLDTTDTQSKSTPIGKYKVILSKPDYFHIEFIIESLGFSMASLPKGTTGINSQPTIVKEVADRCMTYYFQIRMNGTFYKIQSGDTRSIEYEKWANWLFEELRKVNYAE